MKKLISLTLMFVVLLCTMPAAYAMEETEPIEGSTPSVKTLAELQAAIETADDGDQIQILDSIVFDSGEYCVGASDKTIELLYDNYSGGRELFVVNAAVTRITLQNISVIGNGLDCDTVLKTSSKNQEVLLSNVTIQGLSTSYPICNTGTMEVRNCSFRDNIGIFAGHIKNEKGTLTVSGSTFVGGKSGGYGGAIYNLATLSVSNSVFENNYANYGGAIYSSGNSEITNSRITKNNAKYSSGGISNTGTIMNSMVITDCEIYGNTAGQWADDISNETKITIQYTKNISDIYSTTDRIPRGWQSDNSGNRKGITDVVEYNIPIVSTKSVDGFLYLRFTFEDELKTDNTDEENEDDTTPTNPEDVPTDPSEPEDTEPTTPSEPEDTKPTEPSEPKVTEPSTPPSEPEVTEPTEPSEPDTPDPTLPSEPETTDPTQGKTDPTETEPGETEPEVPAETTPDESDPSEESTPPTEVPDDDFLPEEPDKTESTQPTIPEGSEDPTVPTDDSILADSGENPPVDPNEPDDTETTVPSTGGAEDTTPSEPDHSEDMQPTAPESSEVPTIPPIEDDAESAESGDTEDTPPVIQDGIGHAPTIPDGTEPHIPPSEDQDETIATESDNEPSVPTGKAEQGTPQETVPVTEPASNDAENIEQITPPEEMDCNDVPNEPDDHAQSNLTDKTPSESSTQDIWDGASSKNDVSTSSQIEGGRNQGYVERILNENGNLSSGESAADISLEEDAIIDAITDNETQPEPIELNPAVSEHSDNDNWEKVNRIASYLLVISLVELGVLLAILVLWLKRARK